MLTQDDRGEESRSRWGECRRVGRGWVSDPDPSGLADPMKDGEVRERLALGMLS